MKFWMSRGEFLERRRGGAAAAGTRRDQRHEDAKAHGLQQFLRDLHFERAVAVRLGRQRHADGVADALLQQHAHRRRRRDDALPAHAGLGEPEMQRVVGAPRQLEIDRDQVLHRRDLGRQDDAVLRQADFVRARGGQQRRLHHRLMRDFAVHAVARIMTLAGPSQVLVSAVAVGLAEGSGMAVEAAGSHAVKGLERPVEVYRLVT